SVRSLRMNPKQAEYSHTFDLRLCRLDSDYGRRNWVSDSGMRSRHAAAAGRGGQAKISSSVSRCVCPSWFLSLTQSSGKGRYRHHGDTTIYADVSSRRRCSLFGDVRRRPFSGIQASVIDVAHWVETALAGGGAALRKESVALMTSALVPPGTARRMAMGS